MQSNIGSFLEKFKKFLTSEENIKEEIIKSVLKNTGIEIKGENIKIQDFSIYIKEKPIIKSEIFLKKEKILEDLSQDLKNRVFKNII